MEDMSKLCDRFQQFCSNSARPLLLGGAIGTLASAILIGYLACTSNAFLAKLVQVLPESSSTTTKTDLTLSYYLQLAATLYLLLVALLVFIAAYYDQKHAIRMLAILTTINVVLAVAGVVLMPPMGQQLAAQLKEPLSKLQSSYNYTRSDPIQALNSKLEKEDSKPSSAEQVSNQNLPKVLPSSAAGNGAPKEGPTKRDADGSDPPTTTDDATEIWDHLQSQGCCGFDKAEEWTKKPKSCCEKTKEQVKDGEHTCPTVDEQHNRPCKEVIEYTATTKLVALIGLVGLINLYLAIITIIGAYRTLHYDEASQNAYN